MEGVVEGMVGGGKRKEYGGLGVMVGGEEVDGEKVLIKVEGFLKVGEGEDGVKEGDDCVGFICC